MPRVSPDSEPLRGLLTAIEAEARSAPFDVCVETYAQAGRDPAVPIAVAGNPSARWCAVGRELGREEVIHGEPLVGMGGRRFRRAVHEALLGPAARSERRFDAVLDHVMITNLVPYRPVGNRAYGKRTRDRFRPFVERILAEVFEGERVLALGEHAVKWFARYAADGAVAELWADRAGRFQLSLSIEVLGRTLTLQPLPHPSPLSPFKSEFAALLAARLAG